jgi:dTDP-L-rhamnose 4-epimerase
MKVLITGGAGFIGSHTADRLLKQGYEVRVLDSLQKPIHNAIPEYLDERIEFIAGSATDVRALTEALQGVDYVYHLAAFQDYLPYFSKFVDVNVSSTARIYEIIVRDNLPIKKIIVASSQATLGEGLYLDSDGNEVLPDMRLEEDLKKGIWEPRPPEGKEIYCARTPERISNPQNPYGMSKIAEEMFALQLGKRYDIPSVAMRYSIVQGSRQSFYNAYSGACRIFSLAFHQGKEPQIYEDGNQVRDFVNIHDVVDANLLVLEDDRANYEMFNVGGGAPITVKHFAETVADVFGVKDYNPKPCGKYRFGDTRHIWSDISKLESLGWKPTRTIYDSVSEYKEWLNSASSIDNIIEYCSKKMEELNVLRDVL